MISYWAKIGGSLTLLLIGIFMIIFGNFLIGVVLTKAGGRLMTLIGVIIVVGSGIYICLVLNQNDRRIFYGPSLEETYPPQQPAVRQPNEHHLPAAQELNVNLPAVQHPKQDDQPAVQELNEFNLHAVQEPKQDDLPAVREPKQGDLPARPTAESG